MEDEHVGSGDPFIAVQIVDALVHFEAAEGLRLPAAEDVHDASDPLRTLHAAEHEGDLVFHIVAEFAVEGIQILTDGASVLTAPGRHFHDQHGRADSVLIADFLAGRASDALLISEEIGVAELFRLGDHAADVLKSGQRLEDLDPEVLADRAAEVAGDNGFDHGRVLRQFPLFFHALGHICDQERACLVSVQCRVAALPVCDLDSHSVAVRICRDQDFRSDFAAKLFCQCERLGILRVGISDCSELRIRIFLLRYDGKILIAKHGGQLLHGHAACAVERRIDDRYGQIQLLVLSLPHGHDIIQISQVHLLAQHAHFSLIDRVLKGHLLKAVKQVQRQDLPEHAVRDLAGDLRAVHPVDLVAVVLLGIVAGRQVDAAERREASDGKRQFRRRTKGREKVNCDPVPCKDLRREFRELFGMVAAVIGDRKTPCRILPG